MSTSNSNRLHTQSFITFCMLQIWVTHFEFHWHIFSQILNSHNYGHIEMVIFEWIFYAINWALAQLNNYFVCPLKRQFLHYTIHGSQYLSSFYISCNPDTYKTEFVHLEKICQYFSFCYKFKIVIMNFEKMYKISFIIIT